MSEYLDNILRWWAIATVCPSSNEPQNEYEMRAVKTMISNGLKLLQAAQTDMDAVDSLQAKLDKATKIIQAFSNHDDYIGRKTVMQAADDFLTTSEPVAPTAGSWQDEYDGSENQLSLVHYTPPESYPK